MLGAMELERWLAGRANSGKIDGGAYLHRLLLLLVLTLPLQLVLKLLGANILRGVLKGVSIGYKPGISANATASIFAAAWLALLAVLALGRIPTLPGAWRAILAIAAIAAIGEAVGLASATTNMQFTFKQAQEKATGSVMEGESVIGSGASSLFLPKRVLSLRRVVADDRDGFAHPPPNPEVFERYQPRYVLEKVVFNYRPAEPRYLEERREGYHLVREFEVGPQDGSFKPRYIYALYANQR